MMNLPKDRLHGYIEQLTVEARSRLLVELERLHLVGEDLPGCSTLLEELRAEFRKGGQTHDRVSNPSRYFFQPLEPVLVNAASERTHEGQISRTSLAAIWEWISQCLLPAMAGEYDKQMRSAILAGRRLEAEKGAAAFQTKVAKCLEGILTDAGYAERVRAELALYTASKAILRDVEKMLKVFKAHDALALFVAALPKEIKAFKGRSLSEVRDLLDGLRKDHPEAVPFGLFVVATRLKDPLQLIRLATRFASSANVLDVAATPYAFAVPVVLGVLDESRAKLLEALRQNHALLAKEILARIYDIEHTLRAHIDRLAESEWGSQLDGLMARVAADLEPELRKLPPDLHHVLGSRALHHGDDWPTRLRRLMWRVRSLSLSVVTSWRAHASFKG